MEKLNKANTPLEQIYKNTENIDKLAQYVKPLYNCSIDLSNDADVVDVSDTNLTADVEKALIIDINGNLYNFVAFNEDKTKAYITFYSNIQGPQGEEGPQGPSGADSIDDTTTAADKLWSSQKTNSEIGQIKSIGVIYSTTATPTQDSDAYIFNKTDFITEPLPNWDAIIGKQICQIVDSKIKYIYSVVAANTTTITCVLIGEIGGGAAQKYKHFIFIECRNSNNGYTCIFDIETPENTQYDTYAKVRTALSTYYSGCNIQAYCIVRNSGSNTTCHTIKYDSGSNRIVGCSYSWSDPRYNLTTIQLDTDTYYCTDKVV